MRHGRSARLCIAALACEFEISAGHDTEPMRTLILILCLTLMLVPAGTAVPVAEKIDLIIVEKAKRVLTLYGDGKPVKSYRIVLGGSPVGDKEQEGYLRTPEGRYTIDGKNPNSSFHLSLHVSYPDKQDRTAARRRGVSPGGAIMIHGTPSYIEALYATGVYPDWTAGCIAVSNSDIDEIYKRITVGTTILIKP
jgi:murein L,D-transpeptidase YafK